MSGASMGTDMADSRLPQPKADSFNDRFNAEGSNPLYKSNSHNEQDADLARGLAAKAVAARSNFGLASGPGEQ